MSGYVFVAMCVGRYVCGYVSVWICVSIYECVGVCSGMSVCEFENVWYLSVQLCVCAGMCGGAICIWFCESVGMCV